MEPHCTLRLAALLVLTAALSLAKPVSVWAQAAQAPIAHVSLVAGYAWRTGGDGQRTLLAENTAVYESDRVEVEPGGLLHLQFIDGARLSLRGTSQFYIEAYRNNASGGQQQLKLDQGTLRQITGQWAKRDPQGYRLNTPIAAIGVRGTDFIVQAHSQALQAYLAEGRVWVQPNAPCDLASCQTAFYLDPERPALQWQAGQEPLFFSSAQAEVLQAIVARQTPALPAVRASSAAAEEPAPPVLTASRNDKEGSQLLQAVAGQVLEPKPSQRLVWGRWFDAEALDGATERYLQLLAEGLYPTIANGRYVIMRSEPAQATLSDTLRGQVQLRLESAQAAWVRWGEAQPAVVNGARLAIDFDARRYDTQITISHPNAGVHTIAGQGDIRRDGAFAANGPAGNLLGMLTTDGARSAVLYEKNLGLQQRLEALTLWGR